jgi:branched-chain amino acid transport system ATP-binding protein
LSAEAPSEGTTPERSVTGVPLQTVDLTAGYGGSPVIHGISLTVAPGEVVSIVGPNGSGKSTLLKSIVGVVETLSGRVLIGDADVTGWRSEDIARIGVGYVPQVDDVFAPLTVRENLEMGAYPPNGHAHFRHTLERIHTLFPVLAERAGQLAGTLSGGEQQMLAIGRGLAAAPRLLMLDEPSMGLAPAVADLIFERIAQVHREDGLAILLVEQRVAEALELADRGYVLETGRIVLEGPYDLLLADDRVRRAYLGLGV